jgi:hypothetical protein
MAYKNSLSAVKFKGVPLGNILFSGKIGADRQTE